MCITGIPSRLLKVYVERIWKFRQVMEIIDGDWHGVGGGEVDGTRWMERKRKRKGGGGCEESRRVFRLGFCIKR